MIILLERSISEYRLIPERRMPGGARQPAKDAFLHPLTRAVRSLGERHEPLRFTGRDTGFDAVAQFTDQREAGQRIVGAGQYQDAPVVQQFDQFNGFFAACPPGALKRVGVRVSRFSPPKVAVGWSVN